MNRKERVREYFKGKVVWITGASSGIGRSLSVECARAGAHVIVSSRREELLNALSAELRSFAGSPEVSVLPLDVSNDGEIEDAAKKAISLFGRVDILINNAGISQRSLVRDLEYPVVEKILRTDFLGAAHITLEILKSMYKTGGGHIVVLSSVMGKFSTPLRSAYCAAKHALHGFYESLAAEGSADGIAVTIILPGSIRTDISLHALEGNGAAHGAMGAALSAGMSAPEAAARMLRAIAARKYEYYVAVDFRMKLALLLKKLMPRLLLRITRSVKTT